MTENELPPPVPFGYCHYPGCVSSTREKKPFCPDHVEHHPYVQEVLAELGKREDEIADVRRHGSVAVNINGTQCQEIWQYLRRHGGRSLERIARDCLLDRSVAKSYVAALAQEGKAQYGKTPRGVSVVYALPLLKVPSEAAG